MTYFPRSEALDVSTIQPTDLIEFAGRQIPASQFTVIRGARTPWADSATRGMLSDPDPVPESASEQTTASARSTNVDIGDEIVAILDHSRPSVRK